MSCYLHAFPLLQASPGAIFAFFLSPVIFLRTARGPTRSNRASSGLWDHPRSGCRRLAAARPHARVRSPGYSRSPCSGHRAEAARGDLSRRRSQRPRPGRPLRARPRSPRARVRQGSAGPLPFFARSRRRRSLPPRGNSPPPAPPRGTARDPREEGRNARSRERRVCPALAPSAPGFPLSRSRRTPPTPPRATSAGPVQLDRPLKLFPGDRRRSPFHHHDPPGVVREKRCLVERRSCAERESVGADHGIPRSGHIRDLVASVDGKNARGPAVLEERHAVFSASYEERTQPKLLEELPARLFQGRLVMPDADAESRLDLPLFPLCPAK